MALREITLADYARHVGVNPSAMSHGIGRGIIQKLPSGRLDFDQAEREYGQRHRERVATHAARAASYSKRERAEITLVKAKLEMARQNLRRFEKQYVDRAEARAHLLRVVERSAQACSTRLRASPPRTAKSSRRRGSSLLPTSSRCWPGPWK